MALSSAPILGQRLLFQKLQNNQHWDYQCQHKLLVRGRSARHQTQDMLLFPILRERGGARRRSLGQESSLASTELQNLLGGVGALQGPVLLALPRCPLLTHSLLLVSWKERDLLLDTHTVALIQVASMLTKSSLPVKSFSLAFCPSCGW